MKMVDCTAADDELSTVCKELDALALSYLGKLDEYSQHWKVTSDRLQQGFLHLAHAKYTMGSGAISRLSYDERMKAQVKVTLHSEKNGYKVQLNDSSQQELEPETVFLPAGNGVRLRERTRYEASEWVQDENLMDAADIEEFEMNEKRIIPPSKSRRKKTSKEDPLHWFGLLVSPSLRTTQDDFKTATAQLIDQVNRIHELSALEEQYHRLERKKNILERARLAKQEQQTESTRAPSLNNSECAIHSKDTQPVLA